MNCRSCKSCSRCVLEKVYSAPPSPLFVEGFHGSPPYKNNAGLVVTMVMRTAMHCNGGRDASWKMPYFWARILGDRHFLRTLGQLWKLCLTSSLMMTFPLLTAPRICVTQHPQCTDRGQYYCTVVSFALALVLVEHCSDRALLWVTAVVKSRNKSRDWPGQSFSLIHTETQTNKNTETLKKDTNTAGHI